QSLVRHQRVRPATARYAWQHAAEFPARSRLREHRPLARQESGAGRRYQTSDPTGSVQRLQSREFRRADPAGVRRRDRERGAAGDRRTDLEDGELVAAGAARNQIRVLAKSSRKTFERRARGARKEEIYNNSLRAQRALRSKRHSSAASQT